jgi:hypothetical protein
MTLMKETPGTPGGAPSGAKGSTGAGYWRKRRHRSSALVMNSRITVLLERAKLNYKDDITGDVYNVNKLNFSLEDVSPSSDMPFELSADLDMLVQHKIRSPAPW